MKRHMVVVLFASAAGLLLSTRHAAESAQFPDDFRRWALVGTTVIMPDTTPQLKTNEGIHHIFANQKALDGYSSGDFADGSIIVFEVREAQQKGNGVILEGERKRVDVMIKDSSLYKSTGGWRFERFWGTDQAQDAVENSGTKCFECHSKASAHGLVFSQLH